MDNTPMNAKASFQYNPIAYHDSWISVDPIIGCTLDCQYCFMQLTNSSGIKPKHLYSIPQIVDMLVNHKYFAPHRTVLSFGNQTDSFLPENVPLTLEFFKRLEELEFTNPVAVVTKKRIPGYFLDEISKCTHVKPIFCLSYSGLPPGIERGFNPEDSRENFKNLAGNHFHVIHFWRPLTEVNVTQEVLENILDFVVQYSSASVYIGLKLNPALNNIYCKILDLKIPQKLLSSFGDYIPDGVEERLKALVSSKFPGYPLYKHTSCAVSLNLSIPDYNATIYRDVICKESRCPDTQRQLCEKACTTPDPEMVAKCLHHIGLNCDFDFTEDSIQLSDRISQEDFSFLLHQLNYPINNQKINFTRGLRGSIFRKDDKKSTNENQITKGG